MKTMNSGEVITIMFWDIQTSVCIFLDLDQERLMLLNSPDFEKIRMLEIHAKHQHRQ